MAIGGRVKAVVVPLTAVVGIGSILAFSEPALAAEAIPPRPPLHRRLAGMVAAAVRQVAPIAWPRPAARAPAAPAAPAGLASLARPSTAARAPPPRL